MKKSYLKHPPKFKSLAEMYTLPYIYGTATSALKWSPDNSKLTFLWNAEGHLLKDLYTFNQKGNLQKLTDVAQIEALPVEDDKRDMEDVDYAQLMYGGVSDYVWAPNSDYIVFGCRGNIYKYIFATSETVTLISTPQGKGSLQISADGKFLTFTSNNNVWSFNLQSGQLSQLTFFSQAGIRVSRYVISPDSQFISLIVTDSSMYETVKMPDYSPKKEVKIIELKRNNVGKPLAKHRIGLIPITGGKMKRMALPAINADEADGKGTETGHKLIVQDMQWTLDSSSFVLACSCSKYKNFHLVNFKVDQELGQDLYHAKYEPWSNWVRLQASPDGQSMYFLNYQNDRHHISKVGTKDSKLTQITTGDFDVSSYEIPAKSSKIFYSASHPDPQKRSFYTADLDGNNIEKIDLDLAWVNGIPSIDGTKLALTASEVMHPEQIFIKDIDGPCLPKLEIATADFADLPKGTTTQITFKNKSDGETIRARMMVPENFDPTKKHPVVMSCVYADQGKMSFGRYNLLDNYMANEMGYIIIGVDLRASVGYGQKFNQGYHKSLGIIDSEELVSCAEHLKQFDYVDGDRIGIWGGSYGGFLTLMVMSLYPGVFHTGVSWKPVTDWRNYWDSYTYPRLTNPAEDAQIFKDCSPVWHADKLEGNLLLIHGMLDDNVLFQDAVWMIQKMIEAEKYFDLMIYPRDNHGLELRHESLPDCMERIAAYFEEHMGRGPGY